MEAGFDDERGGVVKLEKVICFRGREKFRLFP